MIPLIGKQIITVVILSISNMLFRGGGLESYTGKNNSWGKPVHLILTALLLWWNLGLSWFILSGTVAMWVGMIPGWGSYIGAIHGNGAYSREQNKLIDWLIKPLVKHPVTWGIVGLSLRGLIWTSALGVGLLNPWIAPLGLSMGPIYWLATKIKTKWIDPWKLGEVMFGIVVAIGLLIGTTKKKDK